MAVARISTSLFFLPEGSVSSWFAALPIRSFGSNVSFDFFQIFFLDGKKIELREPAP